VLEGFAFLPGGRILAGAGSGPRPMLINCFVMGPLADSMGGICRALAEAALTLQRGGGIGIDFSPLRPYGAPARTAGTIASGPVSFIGVFDALCATIQSTGARRGALMATLRCDHPDIARFIAAKSTPGALAHSNLSVLVSDAFLAAIRRGDDWSLQAAPGEARARVPAAALWQNLLRASYASGEPGVLFIDRINRLNNLAYCEQISATNPCGEVPLPPYGACDLGSVNLARLIRDPFTRTARLDTERLAEIVPVAVRMLDNVIDASRFPLRRQRDAARRTRRIGLGITGLADALVMLGLRYGDDASLAFASSTMRAIRDAAYRASAVLAAGKGSFPAFQRAPYLDAPFIAALPGDIRDAIGRHGMRNSHLLAIAPTGTISLLAGNVSSGIEPVFAADQRRRVRDEAGNPVEFLASDFAVQMWRDRQGGARTLPPALVTAAELDAEAHLDMQAALQPHVDNAISKTINLPESLAFEDVAGVFARAYDKGLKGCTVFRPGAVSVGQCGCPVCAAAD
jgi:ribonucleoside-diphosphate reductase alpha chain